MATLVYDKTEDKTEKDKIETIHPIILRPHQGPHFKKVLEILEKWFGYVDSSRTGGGKTIIALAVAATYGLNLVVVCNLSMVDKWKSAAKYYGINLLHVITYQSLRGTTKEDAYTMGHGLLVRDGEFFEASDTFNDCVKSRLLLIFDEFQNVKNNNAQLASCHALVKAVIALGKEGHVARIGLLSAIPCDKKEHASSVFKMLGIITSDDLYKYEKGTRQYNLIGLKEAIDKCNKLNPDVTFDITVKPINRVTINTICYELYTRIIKDHYVSEMPKPPEDKDAKNGYYMMEPADLNKLIEGVQLLSSAAKYRPDKGSVSLSRGCWQDITKALITIESAKINTIARLVKQKLDGDPNCKVVVYLNYLKHIDQMVELLAKYNPLHMNGRTPKNKRTEMFGQFQSNDNKYRLLICNPKVGGVGVDLDDIVGTHPRFMFIVPTYNYINDHQATGRICRADTIGTATIRFIYSKDHPNETGILQAIIRKNNVARNMIIDANKSTVLPGEYGAEVEVAMGIFEATDISNLILDQLKLNLGE